MSSDLTSLQPIGDAHLLVEFELDTINGKPNVTVNGAYGDGERGGFIEASCFSADQLVRWESAIRLEVLDDGEQRNTLARACGKANSRRFSTEPEQHSAFGSFA